MRRSAAFLTLLLAAALGGCVTNPYTGRSQLMLIDTGTEMQLGVKSYQEVLGKERISTDRAETDPVQRVGRRIAAAADKPEFAWEFNVIVDDRTVNAWCLPGGKIAFYTGLYPALDDEAGMAFVMGHEVAHALARHGAERISLNMLSGVVGSVLAQAIGGRNEENQAKVLACYGLASNLAVLLPYSREHEAEADTIGLELMAKAGYDPKAGVEVWKRMEKISPNSTPEFLSTHPSHGSRIEELEKQVPAVMAKHGTAAKAPVAKLPAISGLRSGAGAATGDALAAGPAPPAEGVTIQPSGCQRGALQDGRKAVFFAFTPNRDVYVASVKVEAPGGASCTFEPKEGTHAGAARTVFVNRSAAAEPDFEAGRYTVRFSGRSSGRSFEAVCHYDVP